MSMYCWHTADTELSLVSLLYWKQIPQALCNESSEVKFHCYLLSVSLWRKVYPQELYSNLSINQGPLADLDPIVDEAAAVSSRPQMGVLLCTGHLDAPHWLPGLVELAVNWVNSRVVWRHCIAHICWDAVLLERGRCGESTGCGWISRFRGTLLLLLVQTPDVSSNCHFICAVSTNVCNTGKY